MIYIFFYFSSKWIFNCIWMEIWLTKELLKHEIQLSSSIIDCVANYIIIMKLVDANDALKAVVRLKNQVVLQWVVPRIHWVRDNSIINILKVSTFRWFFNFSSVECNCTIEWPNLSSSALTNNEKKNRIETKEIQKNEIEMDSTWI